MTKDFKLSDIPNNQWHNWAERIMRGEHLEEEMQNAGVLPSADTPLPPTNATIHLLDSEIGYGTPDRTFVALCGVYWAARGSTGEHKYFMRGDDLWHKHINCSQCKSLMDAT
jgi:hypothetical protein